MFTYIVLFNKFLETSTVNAQGQNALLHTRANIVRISYGNSVCPSVCLYWCHDPVPFKVWV